MNRMVAAGLAVVAFWGASARAQTLIVGPGSTPQGDYLRGVGVAAIGLGQYNLNTAIAGNIEAHTAMEWDAYWRAVIAIENRERARIAAAKIAAHLKNYKAIRQRVLNSPEMLDVQTGNALNALLDFLNQGRISAQERRSNAIPLPVALVRKIPFQYGEQGTVLSLTRLMHPGKADWPVAFQDPSFVREVKEFDRAIRDAVDEQIEGKVQQKTLDRVDRALDALSKTLNQRQAEGRIDRDTYAYANTHLLDLRALCRLLRSHQLEKVVGELATYSYTTVDDLLTFMTRHKIRFAPAVHPDERGAYREVFAALQAQRELLDPEAKQERLNRQEGAINPDEPKR